MMIISGDFTLIIVLKLRGHMLPLSEGPYLTDFIDLLQYPALCLASPQSIGVNSLGIREVSFGFASFSSHLIDRQRSSCDS